MNAARGPIAQIRLWGKPRQYTHEMEAGARNFVKDLRGGRRAIILKSPQP